jgi:hypothetical protein
VTLPIACVSWRAVRVWTLDEANAALPDVVGTVARVGELVREVAAGRARAGGNGHRGNGDGAAAANRELQRLLESLDADGIVVRDPERGLIDFTAESPSGRRYWLCHLRGETSIDWWHWPEDGYAGRRPIDALPD